MVGVLKGSFVFLADLVRALARAGALPRIEFMRLASYGQAKESSGEVLLLGDAPRDFEGRPVLLVDDIVDTGLSMAYGRRLLTGRNAVRGLDLRAARQAVPAQGRQPARLHRLRDPGRVRGRLRHRLRRAVPLSALHRQGDLTRRPISAG